MKNLVFLGPPGAGKGTQARMTAERLGVPHLSTGDMLRAAVRDGTEVGQEARAHMDAGQLVPDELVGRIVAGVLGTKLCAAGFLLDGYPRNIRQARQLDSALGRMGRDLQLVLLLDVPDTVLEARLTGRRSCPACSAMYHVGSKPPATDGVCDACGAALEVRADDRPEVIQQRLEVYHSETKPLIEHYHEKGILKRIDGTLGIEDVQQSIGVIVDNI